VASWFLSFFHGPTANKLEKLDLDKKDEVKDVNEGFAFLLGGGNESQDLSFFSIFFHYWKFFYAE